jgi:hypothetical protein
MASVVNQNFRFDAEKNRPSIPILSPRGVKGGRQAFSFSLRLSLQGHTYTQLISEAFNAIQVPS